MRDWPEPRGREKGGFMPLPINRAASARKQPLPGLRLSSVPVRGIVFGLFPCLAGFPSSCSPLEINHPTS